MTKQKFVRQDTHKKKRLSKIWRKPRGVDSKKRLRMQNRVIVSPGYRTPKSHRNKINGQDICYVNSISQLEKLDPKKQSIVVSAKIGLKRKIPLLEKLIENKFKILNISDPQNYLKAKKSELEKKKEQQKEKEITKKKEVKKKKESIEDKLSEEEKKKLEKKEIDKLLTKKN
jgi:ribosomal protein L32E